MPEQASQRGKRSLPLLAPAAMDIIFGDIGTSLLYTFQDCFGGPPGVPPSPANVLGVVPVALWFVNGVVTFKWLVGYDALAGELRALFPRRKAFVNSFFPDAKKPRKAGGADGAVG